MRLNVLLFLGIFLALSRAEKRYNGYKLYTVKNSLNATQFQALVDLQKKTRLDFWSDPSASRETDFMAAPQEILQVEEYLTNHHIPYKVAMQNVQRAVEKEPRRTNRQGLMSWKQYQRLNVIYSWMDSLAYQYPSLITVSSIGTSSEGREIKMLKIATGRYKHNPAIYVDGGIHAREWISPATATFVIRELISNGIENRDLLDSIDWYFVPVVNPDGYEFTHTEDRLWRKSRSKQEGEDCIGVDINRNFGFHWGEAGVKDDPCANTYHGPHAFSEPEANATAAFLWNNRGKIKLYLTFHSYSQLLLTPYGYTEDLPDDYDDLLEVGQKAMKALEEVHGTEYEVGPPSHILYSNSGSSRDWAREFGGAKLSYTLELRDDGSQHKFLLPDSEIQPTGEETWAAVKSLATSLLALERETTTPVHDNYENNNENEPDPDDSQEDDD